MSSVCRNIYKDYGSYLRSRGFDKQTCDYLSRIIELEENKFNISGGEIFGDLDVNYNNILDVSSITFGNGSILTQTDISNLKLDDVVYKTGTQMKGTIDMSNNSITNANNIGIYNAGVLSRDIDNNLRLVSTSNNIVLSSANNINITAGSTNNININSDVSINSILDLQDNSINNVGSLELTNGTSYPGRLQTTSFTTSASPNYNLPSYDVSGITNPISLERKAIYYNNVSYPMTDGPSTTTFIINNELPLSNYELVNQMGLTVDASSIITPSSALEGQYVEIYITINITTTHNNSDFSIDVSGIDNTLYETVDVRSVRKTGTYNLSFGPLLILPTQFVGGNKFEFLLVNSPTSQEITINSSKLVMKSFFI
jgi:hypothetical protein